MNITIANYLPRFITPKEKRDELLYKLETELKTSDEWRKMIILPDFKDEIKIMNSFSSSENKNLGEQFQRFILIHNQSILDSLSTPVECEFTHFFYYFMNIPTIILLTKGKVDKWISETMNSHHLNYSEERNKQTILKLREEILKSTDMIITSVTRYKELLELYRVLIPKLILESQKDVPQSDTRFTAFDRLERNKNRSLVRSWQRDFINSLVISADIKPIIEKIELYKSITLDVVNINKLFLDIKEVIKLVNEICVKLHIDFKGFPNLNDSNHLILLKCGGPELALNTEHILKLKNEVEIRLNDLTNKTKIFKTTADDIFKINQSYYLYKRSVSYAEDFIVTYNLSIQENIRNIFINYISSLN